MTRIIATLAAGLLASSLAVLGARPAAASSGADLEFPPAHGDWPRVTPADRGWDAAALERALAYAGEQRSSSVVVLLDGRLMAERSWPLPEAERSAGYTNMRRADTGDGRPREDVASAQKSIVALLLGIAEREKLVDPEQSVSSILGAGWSKAGDPAEGRILVRHLMTMTSGLDGSLAARAEPGTRWAYNTRAYAVLVPVLEKAVGADVDALTRRWLTGPLGMEESAWEQRPWVTGDLDANSVGFVTSARDLARVGVLMLAGGRFAGTDVIGNPGYLERMVRPSQSLNPSYGLLWWLNGQAFSLRAGGRRSEGSLVPTAPADMFAALGALGRKLYVVPSLGLVVTRLGDQPPADDFDEQLWKLLMAAAPRS